MQSPALIARHARVCDLPNVTPLWLCCDTQIMAIYAILGVEYFSNFGLTEGCNDGDSYCYQTRLQVGVPPDAIFESANVTSMSARSLPYGYEYYGSFSRALYTLFQVLTGESWAEAVARPLVFGSDKESQPSWFVGLYFATFILLTQIVLVNVVVAVLLDQFVTDVDSTVGIHPDGNIIARVQLLQEKVLNIEEKLSTHMNKMHTQASCISRENHAQMPTEQIASMQSSMPMAMNA
jgi:hypothetical protein